IGNWVLAEVCAQIVDWGKAGLEEQRVAVNLSARQFAGETLIDDIARIVRESSVSPGLLEFELTESMVMRDAEQATATMSALKSMGFRLPSTISARAIRRLRGSSASPSIASSSTAPSSRVCPMTTRTWPSPG